MNQKKARFLRDFLKKEGLHKEKKVKIEDLKVEYYSTPRPERWNFIGEESLRKAIKRKGNVKYQVLQLIVS